MINSLFDPSAQDSDSGIEPFVYPHGPKSASNSSAAAPERETARVGPAPEEQARQQARSEAHAELTAVYEKRLAEEQAELGAALEAFEGERRRYFQKLEREVVQLSLALARKILHREAQFDPLLLAGAVRVSLDQLAGAAELRLSVPADRVAIWQKWTQTLNHGIRPQVRPDAQLSGAACRLTADSGSCELSLDLQMADVERSVLDLVQRRQP